MKTVSQSVNQMLTGTLSVEMLKAYQRHLIALGGTKTSAREMLQWLRQMCDTMQDDWGGRRIGERSTVGTVFMLPIVSETRLGRRE